MITWSSSMLHVENFVVFFFFFFVADSKRFVTTLPIHVAERKCEFSGSIWRSWRRQWGFCPEEAWNFTAASLQWSNAVLCVCYFLPSCTYDAQLIRPRCFPVAFACLHVAWLLSVAFGAVARSRASRISKHSRWTLHVLTKQHISTNFFPFPNICAHCTLPCYASQPRLKAECAVFVYQELVGKNAKVLRLTTAHPSQSRSS